MSESSAIVYLLNNNPKDINNFRQSISLTINNYYKNFPCDIICFYEPDFPTKELEYLKSALSGIRIVFYEIEFLLPKYSEDILNSIPKFFPHPDFPNAQGFSIGYRHMCRFFAGEIFKYPQLSEYKYLWRLDTDSFLVSEINYNVFDKLSTNNCFYGYINIQHDHPGVIKNLWELSEKYFTSIQKDHIFQKPDIDFHKNRVFYTNFEVYDTNWFRGEDYQKYYNFIDNTAGIYKYRWGDHSIRYIAINSLLKPEQTHFYDDIRYVHHIEFYNNRIMDTFNGN